MTEQPEVFKHKVLTDGKTVIDTLVDLGWCPSKRRAKREIDEHKVWIAGSPENLSLRELRIGETLSYVRWQRPLIEELYEDEHLLIVNKPPGIESTECTKRMSKIKEIDLQTVHRLDKYTTGALIFAKDELVLKRMITLFKSERVLKYYLALCWGELSQESGEYMSHLLKKPGPSKPIIKSLSYRSKGSLKAVTRWKVLNQYSNCALISCYPVTGKTHQIRIHLHDKGCPVIGDSLYGKEPRTSDLVSDQHMLHAYSINFPHPMTRKKVIVKAPLFQAMAETVKELGAAESFTELNGRVYLKEEALQESSSWLFRRQSASRFSH